MTVKCLGSDTTIGTFDEVFDELTHLLCVYKSIADRLTDEAYLHLKQAGAVEVTGTIVDQGMMLALGNDRLKQLIDVGHALRRNNQAAKRVHTWAAGQKG
jgi:hypothetical protein